MRPYFIVLQLACLLKMPFLETKDMDGFVQRQDVTFVKKISPYSVVVDAKDNLTQQPYISVKPVVRTILCDRVHNQDRQTLHLYSSRSSSSCVNLMVDKMIPFL
ncbi:Serine/threonine-protein kinase TIO [Trichinella pseudospiralis]